MISKRISESPAGTAPALKYVLLGAAGLSALLICTFLWVISPYRSAEVQAFPTYRADFAELYRSLQRLDENQGISSLGYSEMEAEPTVVYEGINLRPEELQRKLPEQDRILLSKAVVIVEKHRIAGVSIDEEKSMYVLMSPGGVLGSDRAYLYCPEEGAGIPARSIEIPGDPNWFVVVR